MADMVMALDSYGTNLRKASASSSSNFDSMLHSHSLCLGSRQSLKSVCLLSVAMSNSWAPHTSLRSCVPEKSRSSGSGTMYERPSQIAAT